MIRVNELIMREVSQFLHTRYREKSTYITITEVSVSPDLRNATIYYSVLGDQPRQNAVKRFLDKVTKEARAAVSKVMTLKYMPNFVFAYDQSIQRGMDILDKIDALPEEVELVEEEDPWEEQ